MKFVLIGILVLVVIAVIGSKIMGISPLGLNLHNKVFQKKGMAISGYDPVEYHVSRKATKGQESYAVEWNNATWLFSSKENQELFEGNPEKYAPQFGGYCAFAVSKGFTAPGNAEIWHIGKGKLYLFSNEAVKKDALEAFTKIRTSALKKWK